MHSGGTISAASPFSLTESIGHGTFTQSGGSNAATSLSIGTSGTYTLAGGTLGVTASITGPGPLVVSGGYWSAGTISAPLIFAPNPTDNVSYSLDGSGPLAGTTYVGLAGTASVSQATGAKQTSLLQLGNNAGATGSYLLSGGSLSAGTVVLGWSGTGAFTQSGGANSISGPLYLGYDPGAAGTYTLSAGQLTANLGEVGAAGPGTFTQAGGCNTTASLGVAGTYTLRGGTNNAGSLHLGGGSTIYNLGGGLLITSSVSTSATPLLDFTGGTLQASAPFSTTVPISLAASGGSATIDTAGYALTLAGSLSGPGGLVKTDGGTLTLSANNTYTGGTTVNGGLLSLAGSLSAAGPLTVGGGTLSYAPTANGGTGNTQAVAGLTVSLGLSGISVTGGNTLPLGSIARNIGGAVNFNSGTSGTITTTQPNTSGILGPWATYGSASSMAYAMADGVGPPYTVTPYTGATPVTSGVAGLADTTGTLNYALSGGGGALAAAVSANTLQFTGTSNTVTASAANSLSLNGIMNVGSGAATISGGNLIIGEPGTRGHGPGQRDARIGHPGQHRRPVRPDHGRRGHTDPHCRQYVQRRNDGRRRHPGPRQFGGATRQYSRYQRPRPREFRQ